MGKWNRRYMPRPRRRNYQDYQWSPPRDEPCPDPETEIWQDNVPMWEKKFCYLVGRMPWRKVLSTKNFLHCHSNVLNWDDSAGEEAFLKAKKCFWEEISGLPSDAQLPNPDLYIDEIDWNPYIDPKLVTELDREYFNPDDKYYLPSGCSSKANNGWPDDVSNPWELNVQSTPVPDEATGWNKWDHQPDNGNNGKKCGYTVSAVKDKAISWHQCDNRCPDGGVNHPDSGGVQNSSVKGEATGLNQWDASAIDSRNFSKGDDPWESHCTQGNSVHNNSAWGEACHESWGSKPQNQSHMSKNWSVDDNSWRDAGKRWQGSGESSRGWNQRRGGFNKPSYPNGNYKPREHGSHHRSRVPNGNGNAWGQKRWDNSYRETKDSRNISRGRGHFNTGCRKREGPDQYATNHKGPKLQADDFDSSRYWNGANNRRVSFGDQWS